MVGQSARLLTGLLAVAVVGVVFGPPGRSAAPGRTAGPPFAVGLRVLHLVDYTRQIKLHGGRSEPRPLVTYVRYPALGAPSGTDHPSAPAANAAGPFPLVVFGHGYALTPGVYGRLLRAWAAAGYVVAAPVFPLGNANAPGGPDETDLLNQPADLSYVITHLLAASAAPGDPWEGIIDPSRIAISGHSDGAESALAVAYNSRFRDARVRAAVILSGAEISGAGRYVFPPGSPALLAVQGTADRLNPPKFTHFFYRNAARPRYLLTLLRARHLAPYTYQEPQLGIVEHVTIAFLDRYLKAGPQQPLTTAGAAPGIAELTANP